MRDIRIVIAKRLEDMCDGMRCSYLYEPATNLSDSHNRHYP